MTQQHTPALAIIGGGNMGSAIIRGCITAGLIQPGRILVADPDATKHPSLAALGIRTVFAAADLFILRARDFPDAPLLLAVKPQMLPPLLAQCPAEFAAFQGLLISILAGTPIAKLQACVGSGARIIRAMPNLPASIGRGTTALAGTVPAADLAFTRSLFEATGPTVVEIEERLMDAFTAAAGSGPAYLFYLAEAMQQAAITQGFDAATAASITRSTLLGAAEMLAQSPLDPSTLRQQVTSKGGTTEAAINTFECLGVGAGIEAGIASGVTRAIELSR